ncbi:MAG: TetR/AcrR family transcriptional regulator [Lachnospiraceae bacterium]|nr:TetR/AcrR family transcriptional regulator [Lachnospiraceae bacterium]
METKTQTDRRTRKTKKSIQDALLLLLKTKQLNQITITELASAADINRNTFYNHYACVEDAFYEFQDILIDNITKLFEDNDKISNRKQLRPFLQKLEMNIEEHIAEYRIILQFDTTNNIENRLIEVLTPYVSKKYGDKCRENGLQYSYIALFFESGIISCIKKWITNPDISLSILMENILLCCNQAFDLIEKS